MDTMIFLFSLAEIVVLFQLTTPQRRHSRLFPIQFSTLTILHILHFHDVWHMSRVNRSVHHNVLPRRRIILRHIPWDVFRSKCEATTVSKSHRSFIRYTLQYLYSNYSHCENNISLTIDSPGLLGVGFQRNAKVKFVDIKEARVRSYRIPDLCCF